MPRKPYPFPSRFEGVVPLGDREVRWHEFSVTFQNRAKFRARYLRAVELLSRCTFEYVDEDAVPLQRNAIAGALLLAEQDFTDNDSILRTVHSAMQIITSASAKLQSAEKKSPAGVDQVDLLKADLTLGIGLALADANEQPLIAITSDTERLDAVTAIADRGGHLTEGDHAVLRSIDEFQRAIAELMRHNDVNVFVDMDVQQRAALIAVIQSIPENRHLPDMQQRWHDQIIQGGIEAPRFKWRQDVPAPGDYLTSALLKTPKKIESPKAGGTYQRKAAGVVVERVAPDVLRVVDEWNRDHLCKTRGMLLRTDQNLVDPDLLNPHTIAMVNTVRSALESGEDTAEIIRRLGAIKKS